MMRFSCLALFTLFLPGVARRSLRIDNSHNDARQQHSTLAKAFEGSAEAREAFTPFPGSRHAKGALHAASGPEEVKSPPKFPFKPARTTGRPSGQWGSPRRHVAPTMQVTAPVKTVIKLSPTKQMRDVNSDLAPKHKLLLFNDNVHTREYVARAVVSAIPEVSSADAFNIMQKAHKSGFAVVGVWVFEIAEAYCDLLTKAGLLARVIEE